MEWGLSLEVVRDVIGSLASVRWIVLGPIPYLRWRWRRLRTRAGGILSIGWRDDGAVRRPAEGEQGAIAQPISDVPICACMVSLLSFSQTRVCVIEASFKRHNNLFARIRDTHSPFLLAFSSVPPRPWGIEGGGEGEDPGRCCTFSRGSSWDGGGGGGMGFAS